MTTEAEEKPDGRPSNYYLYQRHRQLVRDVTDQLRVQSGVNNLKPSNGLQTILDYFSQDFYAKHPEYKENPSE